VRESGCVYDGGGGGGDVGNDVHGNGGPGIWSLSGSHSRGDGDDGKRSCGVSESGLGSGASDADGGGRPLRLWLDK